ncbi:MAG: metallophosphoesterase family protein, partial [Flavisolibacter sp.]
KYENPDIILIAGDLTKDGEKVSHDQMAILLHQLQNANRKIFVVPGNNDINNTTALGYNGDQSFGVANIPPSYFSTVYSDFGYSGTDRDPNSLSYLAKPYPGLWILAIDAVKYAPKVSRSGVIKSTTMDWIKTQLQKAKESDALVLGLMHHNLIEHFDKQSEGAFAGTVVDNWRAAADSLGSWGLKIVFTGHNHSTDIAVRDTLGRTLYDIETGSLVTAPTSYRIIELKNKELDISTIRVKSIGSVLPDSVDFQTFSRDALIGFLDQWFPRVLQGPLFNIPSQFALEGTPLARDAYMAHMAGEEKISPEEQAALNNYYLLVSNVAFENTINSLWTDNGVKDLKWHIKLTNP